MTAVSPSSVTVTLDNGEQVTMQLNDNTTYRSKKYHHKHKLKRGAGQDGNWHFQPMFEEDDYVEVIYSNTGEPVAAAAESVIVYDD